MKVGFDAFGVAAPRFPRYGSGEVRRTAIEVFPHATVVVLTGCLPAATASKGRWRRGVLESHGVSAGALRSVDQIDATLAALTGLIALRGEFCSVGDPHEGVIVLPVRESALMRPAYRRCRSKAPTLAQPTLPGMSRCVCGDPSCLRSTNGEFAPGHDGKRKSILWRQVRAGDEAVRELVARGWQLPPEMQPRT
jgi:hypothetical protein